MAQEHMQKESTHTNSSVCGSSAITPGKFVETLAQFGAHDDAFSSKAEVENINGTKLRYCLDI